MGETTWLEAVATAVADELDLRARRRNNVDAPDHRHCSHWLSGGKCCCCGDPALPAPEGGASG